MPIISVFVPDKGTIRKPTDIAMITGWEHRENPREIIGNKLGDVVAFVGYFYGKNGSGRNKTPDPQKCFSKVWAKSGGNGFK